MDEIEAWDDQTGKVQNQNLDLSEDESSLAPAPEGEIGNQNWTSNIEQARRTQPCRKQETGMQRDFFKPDHV